MTLPQFVYLFPSNTQIIQITELQDQVTGNFLTGATVTATLYNSRGQADGVLNNIAMSYVNGTDATYQGTVPAAFNAPLGGGYVLQVTAVQGGVQAQYNIPAIVQQRNQ